MSNLTRAEMIEELTEHLNHWKRLLKEGICGKEQGERTIKSLEFAIDSLKVDEAYNLMYEKVDFIVIPDGATNGDVAKSVFGIGSNELHYKVRNPKWWNSPYRKEQE